MRSITALLGAALLTAPLCAGTSIEELAPQNSVVVIGIRNFAATSQRMADHPLAAMLGGAEGELPGGLFDALPEAMRGPLLGEDGEAPSLPKPQGAVGIAIFPAAGAAGIPEAQFMVVADYGTDIERAVAIMEATLDRLPKAAAGDPINVPSITLSEANGIAVRTIRMPIEQPDPNDMNFGGGGGAMNPMDFLPDPADMMSMDEVHFTRTGTALLMTTHRQSLGRAVADATAKLDKNSSFQGVRNNLGENDLYVVLLNRNIMQLAAALDPMGLSAMFVPTLRTFFGQVNGIGYGVSLGGGESRSSQKTVLYTPEGRHGLPALLDNKTARMAPPDFVANGTMAYGSMNMQFDGIVPLLQRIIMGNPMLQMQVAQLAPDLMTRMDGYHQLLAMLDSQVHIVGGVGGDIDASGAVAIKCRNPEGFEAALQAVSGDMALTKQDFEGGVLYVKAEAGNAGNVQNAPMGGMGIPGLGMPSISSSVGLANGYVFIGGTDAIKTCMTAKPAGNLSANAGFKNAMLQLPGGDLVGWGYNNPSPETLGKVDDEAINAIVAAMSGPSLWYVQATDDCLALTLHQLSPAKVVGAE